VRTISFILSVYILILAVLPCPKPFMDSKQASSCCSSTTENSSKNTCEDTPSDNGCEGCNPLASCQCCSVFFLMTSSLSASCDIRITTQDLPGYDAYSQFLPSRASSMVWQPSRFSWFYFNNPSW